MNYFMEKEKHKEYVRTIPGSDTVVLFIHGILGTPDHFEKLVGVVPMKWSVYNILLAGHGGTVEDFTGATMDLWKAQVHHMVKRLSAQYDHILIVAHSMGTLFAISESISNPKIRTLFLLNVPLMVYVHPRIVVISLKIIFGKVSTEDIEATAVQDAFSITPDRNLLKYLHWLPNYFMLFSEIRKTRKKIAKINVPCFIFQSKKDELIIARTALYFKNHPKIRCAVLNHSGHFYYEASDMEYLLDRFQKVCHKIYCHNKDCHNKDC